MKIFELFDKRSIVNWHRKDDLAWKGTFEVGDLSYEIAIINNRSHNASNWYTHFNQITEHGARFDDTGMAGPRATTVLSTVQSAIMEFMVSEKPDRLKFEGAADDPKGEDREASGRGRATAYRRMIHRSSAAIAKIGYRSEIIPGSDGSEFIFRKITPGA